VLPLPVPPLGYEDHFWDADDDGLRSRAVTSLASGPYRSAVPAPIADLSPALPADLASDVEDAAAALSRFDGHARAVLGPGSAALGPMSSILLQAESTSSSQIENLTVGARQLALAEIGHATSDTARTVAGNVAAMQVALDLADRIDDDAIRTVQHEIVSRQRGGASHAGRYRDTLVWVGSTALTPVGAAHVGPQPHLVAPAMDDLVRFMRRDNLPVVVQAAIAHAQFETIHPFRDGNGRTGRALVHALLRSKGLVVSTAAPVSAGLLRDTKAYVAALGAFRRGDARPIVERFTDASRFAATSGAHLVDALAGELDVARTQMAGALRPQAVGWRVLPLLVAHPVLNAALVKDRLAVNDTTAQRALAQLAAAGVLEERTGMRRNRVWQHSGVLAVLDAYAAGLRRS
jgi:Fic family protein